MKGAVLGPGEFFEGLSLGGRQFFEGTVGKLDLDKVSCFHGTDPMLSIPSNPSLTLSFMKQYVVTWHRQKNINSIPFSQCILSVESIPSPCHVMSHMVLLTVVVHVFVTAGGVTGALGKMTGVLGDAAAKLSFNTEFQQDRKKVAGTFGEGVEGAAKVWRNSYICIFY